MKTFFEMLQGYNIPLHDLQIGSLFGKLEALKAKQIWSDLDKTEQLDAMYICYQIRLQMELDAVGQREAYAEAIDKVNSILNEFEATLDKMSMVCNATVHFPLLQYINEIVRESIIKHYGFDSYLKHDAVAFEVYELLTKGGRIKDRLIQPILASDVNLAIITRLQEQSKLTSISIY